MPHVAGPEPTTSESDLGTHLLMALGRALHDRRLDVGDAILRAIEIYDPDAKRETATAYRLIRDAVLEARPTPRRDTGDE